MKNKGFGSLCGIFAICMTSFILFAGIAAGETSKTYDISFNYDEFGHYRTISLAGDDYFVSYDTKYDDIYDGIINDVEIGKDMYNMNLLEHGVVSKILIDSKEKYTVSADDGLELKEGYVIWIKTVEPEKSRLVIELAKDKTIVDKKVVIPGTSDDVYVYDRVDFGADKNIPTIIVRVDDIFTHTYTHDAVVTIEGLFQASDTRAIVKFDEVKKTYVLVDNMSSIDIFLNKLVDGMSSIYLFLNQLFDKISNSPHYAIFFVVLFYPFIHWIRRFKYKFSYRYRSLRRNLSYRYRSFRRNLSYRYRSLRRKLSYIYHFPRRKLSHIYQSIRRRLKRRKSQKPTSAYGSKPKPSNPSPIYTPPKITSAFSYKGAIIQYKVKIENPTSEPLADIKVNLYVPDVFLASESTKNIAMLKPSESKTVTFEIRPTGECGDCMVSGKVVYYDYSTKKTTGIDTPTKSLSIVCPMLKGKEISESEWHSIVSNLIGTEESTKEIDMAAENLFAMISRIVKDMHMHPLNPEIAQSSQIFNGVAHFYGEGVKGLKYAVQVEVVGGVKKSRLILKTWAEKEEALTGFYHGLLDEIEKRVHVKGYINNSIVQNFYHYGDNIGTQMIDSIAVRSTIGTGASEKNCPHCEATIPMQANFCGECGSKI